MTIRSILVEDVRNSREALEKMIRKYCPNIEVVAAVSNIEDAYQKIIQLKPGLLFLDIEMPNGSGFDLLQRLQTIDFDIIFTTAFGHYAEKAFRFCALDYLLKPIDIEQLVKAVRKVEEKQDTSRLKEQYKVLLSNLKHTNNNQNKIALSTQGGLIFVRVDTIIRCQAEGSYTIFFLDGNKKIMVSKSLKEYETLLEKHSFIRIHHSHVINLNRIEKYIKGRGGYVIMEDGSHVDISARKKELFIKAISLNNHSF